MNKEYQAVFQDLVKAYYNDNFEQKVEEIIYTKFKDQQEAKQIIASLCGIEINNDKRKFIYNLKKSITNNAVKNHLITKLEQCAQLCTQNGESPHCVSVCPFDAILYDPIRKKTEIDHDSCLYCGQCIQACKDGRYVDSVQFLPIYQMIKKGEKVVAIVAPAISGQFGMDISLDMLREAFVKIGFSDMIEVAFAADILSIKEAVEFNTHVNSTEDFLITSCCCPMWVGMLKKVYSNLVKDVSPSVSPMIALGKILKKLNPEIKVVFVGPCLAKKAEAKEKDLIGIIDYVLTFEELKLIFEAFEINLSELKGLPSEEYASLGGRLYGRQAGVSKAVEDVINELYPDKSKYFKAVWASGVPNCKELLEKLQRKEISATFIEGMGCVNGCVGGPKRLIDSSLGIEAVNNVAYNSPIKVPTHSEIIDEILKRIEINSLEDFNDASKIQIFEREFE